MGLSRGKQRQFEPRKSAAMPLVGQGVSRRKPPRKSPDRGASPKKSRANHPTCLRGLCRSVVKGGAQRRFLWCASCASRPPRTRATYGARRPPSLWEHAPASPMCRPPHVWRPSGVRSPWVVMKVESHKQVFLQRTAAGRTPVPTMMPPTTSEGSGSRRAP
eukprot:15479051-Alexandrium_andersonii.AAC.1